MAFTIDGVGSQSGNTADLEAALNTSAFLSAGSSTWGTFPDPADGITHPLSGTESSIDIWFVKNTGTPNQATTFNCSVPTPTNPYDPPSGPFTGSMSGKTFTVGMNAGWFTDDGNASYSSIVVDMKIVENQMFIGIPEGLMSTGPFRLFMEFKEITFTHATPGTGGINDATETWTGSGVYFATRSTVADTTTLPKLIQQGSSSAWLNFDETFTSADLSGLDGATTISFSSSLPGGAFPHTVSGTASYELSTALLDATLQGVTVGTYDEADSADDFDDVVNQLVYGLYSTVELGAANSVYW